MAVSIHSGKQAWNLKRGPLQTTVLFKGLLFRFHVCLGECRLGGSLHRCCMTSQMHTGTPVS